MIIIHIKPPFCEDRVRSLHKRWVIETDRRLVMYAGWIWNHEIPGWVSDAWWAFICGVRSFGTPDDEPHHVNWERSWLKFTADILFYQSGYLRQLNVKLQGVEGCRLMDK